MLIRLEQYNKAPAPYCNEGSHLHRLYNEQYHEVEDKGDDKGPGKDLAERSQGAYFRLPPVRT
ncbi:MAG: hypothetical protein IPN55_19265 [Saprospiraceae bacterium]|nr:hypothetical protein [Candidatus Brachybacter algidus]